MLLALTLGACATMPPPPRAEPGPAVVEIAVVGRGWHTDIALPTDGPPLHPMLAALVADFPGARSLVLGFGDRSWLIDRDTSPLGMLRALLPGPGALLLTALATSPEAAFGADHVVRLPLTAAEFRRLQRFLADSLDPGQRLPDGRFRALVEGPYAGSRFHASAIIYSGTYTCNTWTADALAAAGLPVRATGVLFASQVMQRAHQAAVQLSGSARPRCSLPAGSDCCC